MEEVKPVPAEKQKDIKDKKDKKDPVARQRALNDIARLGGPRSHSSWELVSSWRFRPPSAVEIPSYLEGFGYMSAGPDTWCSTPNVRGPQLWLSLGEHTEEATCTWYITDCTLVPCKFDAQKPTWHWQAPRRLSHLRKDLHDPVKRKLGQALYTKLFGDTPFARHWGPVGTSARLRGWFGSLVDAINGGTVPPFVVAVAMTFFHAPGCMEDEASLQDTTLTGSTVGGDEVASTIEPVEDEDYQPIEEDNPILVSKTRHRATAADPGRDDGDLRRAGWVPGFIETDAPQRFRAPPDPIDDDEITQGDPLDAFGGNDIIKKSSWRLRPPSCTSQNPATKLSRNGSTRVMEAWTVDEF